MPWDGRSYFGKPALTEPLVEVGGWADRKEQAGSCDDSAPHMCTEGCLAGIDWIGEEGHEDSFS